MEINTELLPVKTCKTQTDTDHADEKCLQRSSVNSDSVMSIAQLEDISSDIRSDNEDDLSDSDENKLESEPMSVEIELDILSNKTPKLLNWERVIKKNHEQADMCENSIEVEVIPGRNVTNLPKRCMMCEAHLSKYCCPRCSLKTCSLPCVKQHKERDKCSGIRDKTEYIKISKFTHMNMLSDYRLLEDIGRKADNASRDQLKRKHRQPKFLHNLINLTKRRGIRWLSLPYPSTKRKINKTFYNFRSRIIQWHIEWQFPDAEAKYTEKVKETLTLREAVSRYIHATESDPVIRQRLKNYVQAGLENVKLLMKVEKHPVNDLSYYQLNIDQTLAENLSGKCIVEYPIIYVVKCENSEKYKVVPSPVPEPRFLLHKNPVNQKVNSTGHDEEGRSRKRSKLHPPAEDNVSLGAIQSTTEESCVQESDALKTEDASQELVESIKDEISPTNEVVVCTKDEHSSRKDENVSQNKYDMKEGCGNASTCTAAEDGTAIESQNTDDDVRRNDDLNEGGMGTECVVVTAQEISISNNMDDYN